MSRLVLILCLAVFLMSCGKSTQSGSADSVAVSSDSLAAGVTSVEPIADSVLKTSVCTYETFEYGDCPHILFSCGDFGIAYIDGLAKADSLLWQSLTVVGADNMQTANPTYIGKKFEITYMMVNGIPCQAGYGDGVDLKNGPVPSVKSVRLVE